MFISDHKSSETSDFNKMVFKETTSKRKQYKTPLAWELMFYQKNDYEYLSSISGVTQ